MKKTLRSRIFGVITSVMMTVMTFGSVLPEPSAFADDTEPVTISVKVKEQLTDGDDQCVALEGGSNYYVLAGLYDKTDSNTSLSKNTPLAWNIRQLFPDQNNPQPMYTTFDDFRVYNDGTASDDERIRYSPSAHQYTFRVLRTKDYSVALDCYADCYGENKKECYDTFDGYIPKNLGDTLVLVAGSADYKLTISSEEPVNITEADNLYVFVKITHSSGNETYYMEPLVMSGEKKVIDIQKLTHGGEMWMNNNGQVIAGERIHQNEEQFVTLVKFDGKISRDNFGMNNIIHHGNCDYVPDGGLVKSFKVSYKTDKQTEPASETITHFTSNITFSSIPAVEGIDFKNILGDNLNFGIVANKFNRNHHMQTNFAALLYGNQADKGGAGSSAVIEPDLTDISCGEMLIGRIVTFNDDDEKTYTDSEDKFVHFGQSHNHRYTVVRAPEGTEIVCDDTNDPYVTLIEEDVSGRIRSMLDQMIAKSNELTTYEAIAASSLGGGFYELDTTGFKDGTTIFVDGDSLADGMGGTIAGKFSIKKKENQTIIFNFTNTEEVEIGEYSVYVYDDEGNQLNTLTNTRMSTEYHSDINDWLDQQITRHICFNLNSVKNAHLHGTAGMFLIPREDSVTENNGGGASTGWLLTNGFFENGMEWHYVYSEVPDLPAPNSTDVTISKTDITGKEEIEGAELFIYADKDVDDEGNLIIPENSKEPVYFKHWFSEKDAKTGKTARTFGLSAGDYVLLEKGDTIDYNGKTYEVVTSVVRFTVPKPIKDNDGNLIPQPIIVKPQDSVRTSFNSEAAEGYFVNKGDSFTVCNAVIKPTDLKVMKVSDDGKTRVEGAVLEIVPKSGQDISFKDVTSDSKGVTIGKNKITVVTDKEDALIKGLPNGEYTIDETSAPKHYEQLSGLPIAFTLKNGHIMGVTDNADNDYALFSDGTAADDTVSIKIVNEEEEKFEVEITKHDITGDNEVEGAQLFVYSADDVDASGNIKAGAEPVKDGEWVSEVKNGSTAHTLKLYAGEYYLFETAAGEDTFNGTLVSAGDTEKKQFRILDSYVKFTVDKNGKVTAEGKVVKDDVDSTAKESYVVADGSTIKVCDAAVEIPKSVVKIGKYDITGENEISGARLTLSGGSGFSETWTSTGTPKEFELADGVYTLTEEPEEYDEVGGAKVVKLGDGNYYYVVSSKYTFEVVKGIVYFSEKVEDDNGGSIFANEPLSTVKVCNAEYLVPVKITKVNRNNKGVGGAVITITGKTLDKPVTLTSKGNDWSGEVKLRVGEYTLTESSEDGGSLISYGGVNYKVLNGEYKFTVSVDGITKDSGDFGDTGSVTSTRNSIKVVDEYAPVDVEIGKFDITGENQLEGADLVITDENGNTWKNNGKADWKLSLEEGTYTLTETASDKSGMVKLGDDYYKVITSEYKFTVANGKVTYSKQVGNDADGKVFYDDTANIVKVCNALMPKIKLGKYDITGKNEVEGATLTITDSSGKTQSWNSNGRDVWEVVLGNGEYTLTEKATKGGDVIENENGRYRIITSKYKFTVNNGKVVKAEELVCDEGKIVYEDGIVKVLDAYAPVDVKIGKFDITGENELEGAELTITDSTGKTLTNNGKADWTVTLTDGDYTLTETAANADGTVVLKQGGTEAEYKVIKSEYKFTIKNGRLVKSTKVIGGDKDGKIYYDSDSDMIKVCDALVPTGKVKIGKYDITGETPVNGATLTVTDKNDSTKTWTWDSNGKDTWEIELRDGTYTLTETATNGKNVIEDENGRYQIIDSGYEFTVIDGEVTASKQTFGKKGEVVFNDGTIKVCDAYAPVDVEITKFDITGENQLEGANLVITNESGKTWENKGKADWKLSLEDGEYTLTETALDESGIVKLEGKNYRVIKSEYKFTIKNGIVSYSIGVGNFEDGRILYDSTTDVIKVCNALVPPGKVKIGKYNITGETEVKGATLTLTDDKGNVKTWDSNGVDTWDLELEDGTYTLTETATDGGDVIEDENGRYQIIDSGYEFTVKNGEVIASSQTFGKKGEVVFNDGTIKVCDAYAPVDVEITKFDITGENQIEGANLVITNESGKTWENKGKADWKLTLEDGEYTLTETALDETGIVKLEGKNYRVIKSEYTFTIKNGKVTYSEAVGDNENGTIYNDGGVIKVCNALVPPGKVKIGKYNITGETEVKGATLTLTDSEGNVKTWDSNGVDTWDLELEDGTYTLTETATDGGDVIEDENGRYQIIDSGYEFTVKNGEVIASSQTFGKKGEVVFNDGTIKVCDAYAPVDVEITKFDITGENQLEGANLVITNESGKTWENKGKADWKLSLEDGEYTLTETALDESGIVKLEGKNYRVIKSEYKFTIKNGIVSYSIGVGNFEDGRILYDSATDVIKVCNALVPPGKVKIGKYNITGETEVKGATLTLTDSEGNSKTWDSNGVDTWDLELEDGTYTLTETATDGSDVIEDENGRYQIIDSGYEFTVKNGEVIASSQTFGKKGEVVFNDGTIKVCDAYAPVDVEITKFDITGENQIEGANLVITDENGNTWENKGKADWKLTLEDGEYTLTETALDETGIVKLEGKNYRVIKSEYKFTIKNGKVSYSESVGNDEDGKIEHDSKTDVIKVCNALVPPGKVKIGKYNITGEIEVKGATLTLTDSEGNSQTWDSNGVDTWDLELEDGTYTLTETATNGDNVIEDENGRYQIIDSGYEFTVKNGEVIASSQTFGKKGEVVFNDGTIKVCDAYAPVDVEITKFDITGENQLEGANLVITDENGNTWENKGKADWKLTLEDGEYTLIETALDETGIVKLEGKNYRVIKSEYKFTIKNGIVSYSIGVGNFEDGRILYDSATDVIKVCNALVPPGKVKIGKYNITGETEVKGATLTLTDSEGNVNTWDSNGVDTWDLELEDGTYTLTEIATNGENVIEDENGRYQIIDSGYEFTVKNGEVIASSQTFGKKGKVVFNDGTIKVCDAYAPVDVEITKFDITGENQLEGANLVITNESGKTWENKGKADWKLTLEDGEYTLTETALDESGIVKLEGKNYRVIKSEYTFTIKNGKVSYSESVGNDEDGKIEHDSKTDVIKVCNALVPPGKVKIGKYNITGETEVKGATLTLTDSEGNSQTWDSNGVDTWDLELEDGTYTLTETATNGDNVIEDENGRYQIIDSGYEFTVKNGEVIASSQTFGKKGEVVFNDGTIKVCDAYAPVDVEITKFDITGENQLEGANLVITDENGKTWENKGKADWKLTLEDGEYTLTETALDETGIVKLEGKNYRVIKSEYKFTIKNGIVSYSIGVGNFEDGRILYDSKTDVIKVCNALVPPGKVKIGKYNITGETEVKGATLTLTDSEGNSQTWDSNGVDTWDLELEDGTYTLTETATDGSDVIEDENGRYQIIDSGYEFTVKNGEVIASSQTFGKKGEVVFNDGTIKVCDAYAPVDVEITKFDITGENQLKGANLVITNESGKTWENKGKADWKLTLEDGEYTLTETALDESGIVKLEGKNYRVIKSEYTFTIKNGKVSYSAAVGNDEDGKVLYDSKTDVIKVCNALVPPGKVKIGKYNITGETEVKGATLTLTDSEGNSQTWDSNGVDTWDLELEDGTYTLTETATDGGNVIEDENGRYQIIDSGYEFTVKNGEVIASSQTFGKKGEVVFNDGTIKVCDAYAPVDVEITKFDITGENQIEGANLVITNESGKTWENKGKADWKLTLEDGEYTLTETALDETGIVKLEGKNYRVIKSEYTFTIKNGKVTYSEAVGDNENGTIYNDGGVIKVCNALVPPAKVKVNKFDITGENELSGAKIVITSENHDFEAGWISEAGVTKEFELEDGTYTLTERATGASEAPDGTKYIILRDKNNVEGTYKVITSKYTFKVVNGQVEYSSKVGNDETGAIEYDETTDTIKVSNAELITDVKINKFDISGDTELTGAKLTISGGKLEEDLVWTSVEGETWTVSLPDGVYELKETANNPDGTVTLGGKSYKVIETAYRFTIKGGKVTYSEAVGDNENGTIYEEDGVIKVCNAELKTTVTINKYDINGQTELAGAKLTVKDENGNEWTHVSDGVKGNDWTLELSDGKYTLTEAPADETKDYIEDEDGNRYKIISSEYEFTVRGGKVIASDRIFSDGKVIVEDGNHFKVCDAEYDTPGAEVTFNKYTITGEKELGGAKLTVTGDNGVVETWISAEGEDWTLNLPEGKYTLTETVADGGKYYIEGSDGRMYTVIHSEYEFEVSRYGEVTASDQTFDGGKVEYDEKTRYFRISDAEAYEIAVEKKDITGTEEVIGAQLVILDGEGKPVPGINKWESGGEAKTFYLPDGEYILREVATDTENGTFSYTDSETNVTRTYTVVASDVKFTIKDGKVSSSDVVTAAEKEETEPKESHVVFDGSNKFTVCDAEVEETTPTDVTVSKKGIREDGESELPGAQLKLTSADDIDWNSVSANVTLIVERDDSGRQQGISWTSGETEALIKGLPNGTYVLEEFGDQNVEYDGREYLVVAAKFTFTVKNGSIVLEESKAVSDDNGSIKAADENTIVVGDKEAPAPETSTVYISKKGVTGEEELTGATLTLTGYVDWSKVTITNVTATDVTNNQNRIIGKTWVSGGDAADFTGLPDGNYQLVETGDNGTVTDSEGNEYEVITSVFTFTVKDGVITESTRVEDENGSSIDVTDETHIRVSDAQKKEITTDVTISKKGVTTEEELTGATLTLTNKEVDWTNVVIKNVTSTDVTDDNGKVIGKKWVSGGDAADITGLPNGTYELKESGENGSITDSDGNEYEVITSVFEFTVEDGQITDSKKVEEDNGTIDVTDINHIRVSDAQKITETTSDISISKRSIADDTYELGGAILTITNPIVDWSGVSVKNVTATDVTDDSGSVIGKTWVSGSSPAEIKGLPNGTYTLKETGEGIVIVSDDGDKYAVIEAKIDELPEGFDIESGEDIVIFGSDGSNYTIVEAAFIFDVENGKITNSERVQNTDGGNIEATDDTNIVVTDAKNSIPTYSKRTDITVSKKAVNGEDELSGATLTLTCSGIDWSRIDIENEDELTAVAYVTDDEDNVIGITWVSGNVAAKIRNLPNGTYTLKETGESGIIVGGDGNEYTVVDSEFVFTTEEGKIISSTGVKNADDEGSIALTENNTILVSDAEIPGPSEPDTYEISIRKTDVTGITEIKGATLELINENIDWADIIEKTEETGYNFQIVIKDNIAIGISWKSGDEPFTVKGITDAQGFVLRETGDEFTAQDGFTYKVLTSVFKFDIADGAIANAEQIVNADRTGYTSEDNVITVKDIRKTTEDIPGRPTGISITKHDITGDHEIMGASLTLTNEEIDWSKVTADAAFTKVMDENGKQTGISWISNGRSMNVRGLTDSAKYKLKENGTYFKSVTDGRYYEVLDSEFEFEIKNKLIVSKIQIDTTGGKYIGNGTSIKVCDADAKNLVIINKTDITGENEVNGAVIEIQDKDGNVLFTWTSKSGEVYEMILEDGEYKLVEKPADGKENIEDSDSGKSYKVLTSEFKFKISDGKVVTVDSTEANDNDGYVSFDGKYTLTVHDVEVNGGDGDGGSGGNDSGTPGSGLPGGGGNGDGISGGGDGGSGGNGSGDGSNGGSGDSGNGGSGNGDGGNGSGGNGNGGDNGSNNGGSTGGDTSGNPATGVGAGAAVTVALLALTLVRRKKDNEDKDQ